MSTQHTSYTKEEILEKFGNSGFNITPETFKMGIHRLFGAEMAKRFKGKKVIADVCTGGGFSALPLTRAVEKVIAVDIDPRRLRLAQTNATIAGLADKFQFIEGDILSPQVLGTLSNSAVEAISADPDWALPGDDKGNHVRSIYEVRPSVDKLLDALRRVTNNIAVRLPKETNLRELEIFSNYEIEEAFMDDKRKFYTLYFGDLMKREGRTTLSVHTS